MNFGEISAKIEQVKYETFTDELFSKKDALEKLTKIYNDSDKSESELELLVCTIYSGNANN